MIFCEASGLFRKNGFGLPDQCAYNAGTNCTRRIVEYYLTVFRIQVFRANEFSSASSTFCAESLRRLKQANFETLRNSVVVINSKFDKFQSKLRLQNTEKIKISPWEITPVRHLLLLNGSKLTFLSATWKVKRRIQHRTLNSRGVQNSEE